MGASEILDELAALADPKIRAVNQRHGDDHDVNLTKLRAVAKKAGHDPEVARELWATGDTAARLVAILITRPRDYSATELDVMLREARRPKVHDWLVNYLAKKSKHAEELRVLWFADEDPVVASAGWALTSERVAKNPAGLDQDALLKQIQAEMRDAPERLQWAMNQCLATIGIESESRRERAIAIGERLEVLKDYPTPPGCTSPFAPIWINEIVSRREHA
ncbi:DNA alkylation repair protein [Rarobacter faecitabidus]|uniref:3-methyladenine DNA glycosylase AlkD n=1 Tax=Rarobacter faecitabidus TaxID=13243 RepID=A0A542ZUS7_RARFA|nr:DNA alkylation repair protein [Rarobacter faecitabidus]TQL64123.1 3-methyladenine DNA glycosylase AlkD [Rarobacter faecitabidus]